MITYFFVISLLELPLKDCSLKYTSYLSRLEFISYRCISTPQFLILLNLRKIKMNGQKNLRYREYVLIWMNS